MQPLETLGGTAALLIGGVIGLLIRRPALAMGITAGFSLLGAILGFYYAFQQPVPVSLLFSMAFGGGMYSFFTGVVGLFSALGVLFLYRHERLLSAQSGVGDNYRFAREGYALILWAAGSVSLVGASNHLLLSLVALETVTFALIVLVGYHWANTHAPEAAIKYLLLSGVATAILVYGLSYLYGITGTLYLHTLKLVDWKVWQGHLMYRLALGLILVGLLFKLSIFPLHWWAPDVYGGAVPGAAGVAVAFGKVAAAFFLGKVLHVVGLAPEWQIVLAFLAGASALYGNLLAIRQTSLQRLLGYSSIAHGGYLLLGLISGAEGLLQGWAYALAYGLMSLLAFGLFSLDGSPVEIDRLRGVGYERPGYGAALALSLAALSGMPPLMGFLAKYGVFVTAFRSGFLLPALIGLLGALVGYYAYWKPIATLYQVGESRLIAPLPVLSVSVLLLLLVGILPVLLWGWLDYLYGIAGYFGR